MALPFDVRPPSAVHRRYLEWAVLGVALWRVLGVRWTPIVTDDSLGYLQRARAPFSTGFVVDGYRQLGYPLWLWLVEHVMSPLGLDRFFGIVVAQRLVLVVGVVLIWKVLRLWSIPVLWLVTSATMVVLTNFVLNEGVLISLALMAASGIIGAVVTVAPLTGVRAPARPGRWLVAAMAVVAVATVLKLQYVLLGLPIVPVLWALQPRGIRLKPILAAGSVMAALLFAMVVGQTLENSREYDEATPVSEQAHAQWWGAYHAVFNVSPELAERPEVQEFKGHGFSSFYFPLIDNEPDYSVRKRLAERRIDELFEAAGTTRLREHGASFVGGLAGGRHDDLAFYHPPIFSQPPETGLSVNYVAQHEGGVDAVIEQLNDGESSAELNPGALLRGGQLLGSDHSAIYPGLAIAALVIALLGVQLPGRTRWVGPLAAGGQLGGAALLATGYIDIQRYLAPYVVASLCVGMWAMGARAARSADHDGTADPGRTQPSTETGDEAMAEVPAGAS